MAFVVNTGERSVPWYNKNEFFEVFSWLVDSELDSKYLALNRLKIWEERAHGITKQCPIAIISTSCILHTMLQDGIWDWSFISKSLKSGCSNDCFKTLMERISRGEINNYQNNIVYGDGGGGGPLDMHYSVVPLTIKNQYCMTITRIINMFVDQCQHRCYARSISVISDELGIPQILVEIRHQATHGSELPSLEICRVGGILIFYYLISKYWKNQYDCLIESSSALNKSMYGHFDELISLLSNLCFDWDVHHHIEYNNSQNKNKTLLDSYNEYNEIYHGSLLKVVSEYISIKVPMRNKILKHFQLISRSKFKNEKRDANRMIKMLTNFGEFNNNSNVKLGKLKKWVKKCYTLLPVFYRLTEKIIMAMSNNEVDEVILNHFIINGLLDNICPLCCPISEILALYILKLVSNNTKVEVLSRILTALFNNTDIPTNDLKPSKSKTHQKCKQNQKEVRYFYWLRILLPDVGSIRCDNLLNDNKCNDKGNKRAIESILLLTFYKRLQKISYTKRLMDCDKIIETLNLSKYSMLIIFSELISSIIPDIIFKNKTKLNKLTLSVIHLLSDLKVFDSTSKLLSASMNKDQKLSADNIELIKQFLRIGWDDTHTNDKECFNASYKSSRGVIVEEFGITPFLKIGTSWDRDKLEIIDHMYTHQSDSSPDEEYNQTYFNLENINSEDEATTNHVEVNDDIYYCGDIQPSKTITLGMEHIPRTGEQNNPMDMCLLNAEMFMRKNFGSKELMNEMAINIDWNKVKHFSELQ